MSSGPTQLSRGCPTCTWGCLRVALCLVAKKVFVLMRSFLKVERSARKDATSEHQLLVGCALSLRRPTFSLLSQHKGASLALLDLLFRQDWTFVVRGRWQSFGYWILASHPWQAQQTSQNTAQCEQTLASLERPKHLVLILWIIFAPHEPLLELWCLFIIDQLLRGQHGNEH